LGIGESLEAFHVEAVAIRQMHGEFSLAKELRIASIEMMLFPHVVQLLTTVTHTIVKICYTASAAVRLDARQLVWFGVEEVIHVR
jgi:hypothetical protein